MPISAGSYLLDTNILLRLSKHSPEFASIRSVVRSLANKGILLCYTSQNLIEFWNVSTRPASKNGHGLSVEMADEAARQIEIAFRLLPETDAIHLEWRKLVVTRGVSGVQVHDARIVAAMKVHGITHLLTLNERDFERYPEIAAVHPSRIPVES